MHLQFVIVVAVSFLLRLFARHRYHHYHCQKLFLPHHRCYFYRCFRGFFVLFFFWGEGFFFFCRLFVVCFGGFVFICLFCLFYCFFNIFLWYLSISRSRIISMLFVVIISLFLVIICMNTLLLIISPKSSWMNGTGLLCCCCRRYFACWCCFLRRSGFKTYQTK